MRADFPTYIDLTIPDKCPRPEHLPPTKPVFLDLSKDEMPNLLKFTNTADTAIVLDTTTESESMESEEEYINRAETVERMASQFAAEMMMKLDDEIRRQWVDTLELPLLDGTIDNEYLDEEFK